MKKYARIHFLIFLLCFLFIPSAMYAYTRTCDKCDRKFETSESSTSTRCLYCRLGSVRPRPTWNMPVSRPSAVSSVNKWPRKINTKGNRKAVIAAIAIAVGAFLFYEHPWIGIPLILIGLVFAYCFFQENSEKRSPVKRKTPTSPEVSNSLVDNNKENIDQSKVKTTAKSENHLRPTRLPSAPGTSDLSAVFSPQTTIITPVVQQENPTVSPALNVPVITPSVPSEDGSHWYQEGVLFCSGEDGRTVDYNKAIECFKKAKKLHYNNSDQWLNYLESLVNSEK